jgi:hypothetical protein
MTEIYAFDNRKVCSNDPTWQSTSGIKRQPAQRSLGWLGKVEWKLHFLVCNEVIDMHMYYKHVVLPLWVQLQPKSIWLIPRYINSA